MSVRTRAHWQAESKYFDKRFKKEKKNKKKKKGGHFEAKTVMNLTYNIKAHQRAPIPNAKLSKPLSVSQNSNYGFQVIL